MTTFAIALAGHLLAGFVWATITEMTSKGRREGRYLDWPARVAAWIFWLVFALRLLLEPARPKPTSDRMAVGE